MNIPGNILKEKLKNVYFIWGTGKTTIARELRDRFGCFLYATDEARDLHMRKASPQEQPYMCRNFQKEYGVKSFWELPGEVIAERETHILAELTPLVVADLIELSGSHPVIVCEGDIDYGAVIPIATHCVHLNHRGSRFDWFKRPDHEDVSAQIARRTDLTEEEKAAVIQNAYDSVGGQDGAVPEWVLESGIKSISWDDCTDKERTAAEVAEYFGLR